MSSAPFAVPVVFLVFNRPELTARVFQRIREVRPARLFVVADGPRPDRPGEKEKCRCVRELIEQGVDWPCELVRDYSEVNLGCARRIASGITRVFEQVEEAVILEDDCVPELSFFPFCAELLDRYRDDPRIGQIAGCTFRSSRPAGEASYYFSQYPHCWGWATWRRAWACYDHEMNWWRSGEGMRYLAGRIQDSGELAYWRTVLAATASGKIDTWDYRWTASLWARDSMSVLAGVNLVANIGAGVDATHMKDGVALPTHAMAFPLVHPAEIRRDEDGDREVGRRVFRLPTLWARVGKRLRSLFG
jgi:hypothetical protein